MRRNRSDRRGAEPETAARTFVLRASGSERSASPEPHPDTEDAADPVVVDEHAAEDAPSIGDQRVKLGSMDEDLRRREGEEASVHDEETNVVADEHGDLQLVGECERARPA